MIIEPLMVDEILNRVGPSHQLELEPGLKVARTPKAKRKRDRGAKVDYG